MQTRSLWIRAVPLFLGFVGLAMAVGLGALNGAFMTWHFAMGLLSLASIAGSLLWLREVRWRDWAASCVYTVFFLLALALAYLVSANRPQRFDLTRDGIHTLGAQTSSILRRIPAEQSARLELFVAQKDRFAAQKFLANYQRLAPQLSIDLYDPKRDLDVVSQFGGNIREGQFFLSLFDADGTMKRRTDGEISLSNGLREHVLTNAFARLLTDGKETIYWSSGLGEKRLDKTDDSLTKVAEAIAAGAVNIQEFRLMEGRIPADTAAIVIAGPRRDLSDFDFELLKNYLDEGGKLFLMLDPMFEERVPLPNFEKLVTGYGLDMPNEMIIDPLAMSATRVTTTPQAIWAKHPIALATSRVPFLLDRARPIVSQGKADPNVKLEGILVSNEQCWTEPVDSMKSFRRAIPPDDVEKVTNQILSVSVTKQTPGGRWGQRAKIVLIGDSDAFTDRQLATNGDAGAFFLQSVNWLREREDLLQIPPRFVTATPIALTTTTAWTLLGTFLLIGLLITVGGSGFAIARRRMK
ncbi:hypothetical protein GC173_05470 [bacterium]|nr:hypothetical protein [bacterium]